MMAFRHFFFFFFFYESEYFNQVPQKPFPDLDAEELYSGLD